ncbi:MAG: hypothetical protein WDO71_04145 [Bacteroidota bacterium]
MKKLTGSILVLFSVLNTAAQTPSVIPRPKLVVGIVVDQMRWDYLYRIMNVIPMMALNDFYQRALVAKILSSLTHPLIPPRDILLFIPVLYPLLMASLVTTGTGAT